MCEVRLDKMDLEELFHHVREGLVDTATFEKVFKKLIVEQMDARGAGFSTGLLAERPLRVPDLNVITVAWFDIIRKGAEVFVTIPNVESNTIFSHNVKYKLTSKRQNGVLVLKPIQRM